MTPENEGRVGTHIYIGNLRSGTSELAVAELFVPFGRVLKVLFPIGRDTGAPRGFAFVTMGSPAEAAAALAEMGAARLDGRLVSLQAAHDSPWIPVNDPGDPDTPIH